MKDAKYGNIGQERVLESLERVAKEHQLGTISGLDPRGVAEYMWLSLANLDQAMFDARRIQQAAVKTPADGSRTEKS
jgi:hypothetical protein